MKNYCNFSSLLPTNITIAQKMKTYKVERIIKPFKKDSSLELAEETELKINQMTSQGYDLVDVSFHINPHGVNYIYSYLVFKI